MSPKLAEATDRTEGFAPGSRASVWTHVGRFREGTIFSLLVVVVIAFALLNGRFLSGGNIRAVLLGIALLLVISTGQTVVIISRNFDLSVGSTVGLAAMTSGLILKAHPGMPIVLVFAVAIGAGVVVGIINGALITLFSIPSIILTLGMLSVVRGLVYVIAHGQQINPNDVPQRFVSLSTTSPVGIPGIVIIAVVVALVGALLLRWTRSGRSIYAVGSNPDAAVLRGLPSRSLVFGAFVLSGAAAGLGGAIFLSQYGLVQVTAGTGMELQTITAVIIGGTSVFGGAGAVLGTTLGCLLLGTIGNGFAVVGLSTFWQDTAYGLLLLIAVIADAAVRAAREARLMTRPELKL
jgi:rhamnose transport system permease protein